MDALRIQGGRPLKGSIAISGAKNAALPLLCATLLTRGRSLLRNVPDLRDTRTAARLLEQLGAFVKREDGGLAVEIGDHIGYEAPYDLVKRMRASVLVLGPLVARLGRARVSLPGGCAIGARPIEEHLRGLAAMGAHVELKSGYVEVSVPGGRLVGAHIALVCPTVTGTENLMCAASLARGKTTIANAAREPEVVDLARALKLMGVAIEGEGTETITITGQEALAPISYEVMPDRIEAGTYMAAAAATGGSVTLDQMDPQALEPVIHLLREVGAAVEVSERSVHVKGQAEVTPARVRTAPHPGFPTDMQAQVLVLLCRANGRSRVEETVFENRFMHVAELARMGAKVRKRGRVATVDGPCQLQGATVMATDLRASASLVIAGLMAEGTTEVLRIYHLDRGYEQMEVKLRKLGAQVERFAGDL